MSRPSAAAGSQEATSSSRDSSDLVHQVVALILGRRMESNGPFAGIRALLDSQPSSDDEEWSAYDSAVLTSKGPVTVGATTDEVRELIEGLRLLQTAREASRIRERDLAFERIAILGQKIVRRHWLSLLLSTSAEASRAPAADVLVAAGSAATQALGRAPAGPPNPYLSFHSDTDGLADLLGVEILSSGSFPDPFDAGVQALRKTGAIVTTGFENVVLGVLDSPRAHSLCRLMRTGGRLHPLGIGKYLRFMLDLELMRLGQATTPGTYSMLLESIYRGGLLADHSTNISEQVQVIYAEEEWKPALEPQLGTKEEAERDAAALIAGHFRLASDSIVGRDHPREARVSVDHLNLSSIPRYLKHLERSVDRGAADRGGRRVPSRDRVHTVLPVSTVPVQGTVQHVRGLIDAVSRAGMTRLALTSQISRHSPGLLQYFETADALNRVERYAQRQNVHIQDGRTVDLTATANKTMEAVAGALASGHGCVKIGLLGLTDEQMEEFVPLVKEGTGAAHRLEGNQQMVFIGLIDEPFVSSRRVLTRPLDVCKAFLQVMRRSGHNVLLIDTMHKGADDKRLFGKNQEEEHLNEEEFRDVCRSARRGGIDLWAAGSFTEEQVYEVAGWAPEERPGLICLGGAERSFGGLRMEPRDAFDSDGTDPSDVAVRALVNHAADIKFFLSRENKLARDAGHVVGLLKRTNRQRDAATLGQLREGYLTARDECLKALAEAAARVKMSTLNVDDLWRSREEIVTRQRGQRRQLLSTLLGTFIRMRDEYVGQVAAYFDEILPMALGAG